MALTDRKTGLLAPKNRMLGTQLKAAEILLDRVVPRLQRTVLEGDPENPLETNAKLTLDGDLMKAFRKLFEEKF